MNRIQIIAGHYGSGKSEIAVSLALKLAQEGRRVALADLDIVNPYFRSRERAELMEARGIRVISSSLGHRSSLDLPAVSAEVRAPLADPDTDVILDLGGDSAGARVLVGFVPDLRPRGFELLMVVNAYRPETQGVDGVRRHLAAIERTTGLNFTGLISNAHALRDTTADDVLAGYALTRAVGEATGLPVRYVSAIPAALAGLPPGLEGERLPVGLHLRDGWM